MCEICTTATLLALLRASPAELARNAWPHLQLTPPLHEQHLYLRPPLDKGRPHGAVVTLIFTRLEHFFNLPSAIIWVGAPIQLLK